MQAILARALEHENQSDVDGGERRMNSQGDWNRWARARTSIVAFLETWAMRGTAGLAPSAVVRLRVFNLVTLAFGLLGLAYFLWFVFEGEQWTLLAWIRLPVLLWYAALPLIVQRQRRPIAQVGTLLIANANLAAIAVVTGRQTGLQTMFFALVTFPLLIFEPRQRGLLALTMGMPLIARVVFELASPQAPDAPRAFHLFMVVQAFVLLTLPLFWFIREMRRYQTELEDATRALRIENELRAKAEDELEIARRTEAMGRLAAGIAHEINTPLQYVTSNVIFAASSSQQLLRLVNHLDRLMHEPSDATVGPQLAAAIDRAKDDADLHYVQEQLPQALDRALEGLDRVAEVVRSMKDLAHPTRRDMSAVDLNRLIGNAMIVARNEYKAVADAHTELGDIPPVVCYAGEIGQVLLNLLINAGHAVAERVETTATRGHITVRSERIGDNVVISVQDTGAGIGAENAARIFEPFFTTKPVGKGTGQGLAISQAIVVRRHRGTIDFQSEPGRGTTFRVCLPIDQPASRPAPEA
jgi:signal transduction histidine kinase